MSEQERIMNVALLLWGGCFCLTAAFCLSMGNDHNREKRNWLLWMELSAAALLCCDAAAWFVQGTPGEASHLIMVATNFVVYAGLYLVLFLFLSLIHICIYCLRQANREFFGDSPAAVRQEGYLEEVDGLTPEQLTAAYREMLRTASIELIVLGCDDAQTAAIRDALRTELTAIDRAPLPLVENMAMPRQAPAHKTETFDMVQAKLCMLFTLCLLYTYRCV